MAKIGCARTSPYQKRIRLFGRVSRDFLTAALMAFVVAVGFAVGIGQPTQALASTITASSCSKSAVEAAIASANVGDTVQVPSGSCSWSGLSVSKAIHLKGAGVGATNISLTGNNTITKQAAGITRISGFSFSKSGGGNGSKGFTIGGSWQNAEPVIVEGNEFTINGSGLFKIAVAGGVIIADNDFSGGWDDSFIQPKDDGDSGNSWRTADTLGARDTTGKLNLYFEDNTFYGGTNQGIDCDDSTRCVYRYNTLTYSSFNTHGMATSPEGVRHFEVYNNQFLHPGGSSQLANQSWAIWIRGGTGVIFNNHFDNIAGSYWGNKPEMKLSIRGAEDARPQGSCGNVSYPVPRQLGQNHNGSSYFTDPIRIWSNTGATGIGAGWGWGNPCGFSWSTFFQTGRDIVNNGAPKPGYAPYAYPHPLRSGGVTPPPTGDNTAPSNPTNLAVSAASTAQINVSWSASTDNVGVTGYRLERCSGTNCTNFSQIASPNGTSYSDTGLAAGTTYRYRVRAMDAAGNLSGYSSAATATTQNQQSQTSDTTAPSAPGNLQAAAISTSRIDLTWTASTDNLGVAGYRVERCTGASCTNFSQIATPSGTSFSDTGLTANTTYRYQVRATDAAGNLSYRSNRVYGTTLNHTADTTAPSAPGNLQASAASTSRIDLTWAASTDNVGVTGYRVERCTGASCSNFSQIATPSGTSYASTGLSASTTYRYRVRATDAAGNLSSYSNVRSETTQQETSGGPTPLPEGQSGIAAAYPGDANIGSHPDVLFADGFESYSSNSQLGSNWNSYYQSSNTRIATEAGNVFTGNRSLEFQLPQTGSEVSNAVVKNISPTQDRLFVRVYTKFDSGYNGTAQGHNGIRISSNYPGPGQTPDGTDFFFFSLENSRYYNEGEPGYTHVYTYHPEQRSQWGDHWYPDGRVLPYDATPGDFGPDFVARPDFIPQRNRWYSYELMVQANTPGARDGRVAAWIDGNLVADFQNVRVRDISNLKIDQIQLELHGQSSPRVNRKWYDNVVVAKSYIGPMSAANPPTADNSAPSTPTNLSASAASTTQINVSWSTSTDNVGVTGYRLERCTGANCSNFSQIATPSGTSYSNTGLTAGTAYRYRVRAMDAAGNLSSFSSVASATTTTQNQTADTTAPSAPGNLQASAVSATRIDLSWAASTDDVGVTGYRVERCTGLACTNFSQIATPSGTSYSDTGLTADTTYRYIVRATDAAGNLSYRSERVYGTTLNQTADSAAPSVPGNLQASAASSSRIDLSWTPSTDNVGVAGYRLERCTGASCNNFTQIATPSGTSYSNTGLTAGTTYRYRVRATDAVGNLSGYSSVATATTQSQTSDTTASDTTAPSAPGNLQASAVSATRIDLYWAASTDDVGVTGYRVERCTGAGCNNFTQIATPNGTSYSDSGLTADTTYRYLVRATDAAGNLSYRSERVYGTTQNQQNQAEDESGSEQYQATATAEVDGYWTFVDAPSGFADAVVIAGPPSFNDEDPGVARLRYVDDQGFELRFQEWDYLGGQTHANESIPYLVLEPGRQVMSDGSIWEVGTFPLGGIQSWKSVQFSQRFGSAPYLFLTVQTENDLKAVTVRARSVGRSGFEAALFEEEAQNKGHETETVGYLAVQSDSGSGEVDIDGNLFPYVLQSVNVNHRWTLVLNHQLKLEEEQSRDVGVWHPYETVDVLALGQLLFAQQVSNNSVDPTAPRRLPPE